MTDNQLLCKQNTIANGNSDDSYSMPSFPWFPSQTKRKSRLGMHAKERAKALQNMNPNINEQIKPNENTRKPSHNTYENISSTDSRTSNSGTSSTRLIGNHELESPPLADSNFPSRTPVSDFQLGSFSPLPSFKLGSLCPSPLLSFQLPELNSVNQDKIPDLQITSATKPKNIFLQSYMKTSPDNCLEEMIRSANSRGIETCKATPLKSALKKTEGRPPLTTLSIAEKRESTPKKGVRFVEPHAPPPVAAPAPAPAASPKMYPSQEPSPGSLMTVKGKAYRVHRILGRGGSSKVYEVSDAEDNIRALKRVELPQDDDCIAEGYLQEVDMLKKLQTCDVIIRMFDYELIDEEDSRVLYVVMEKGDIDLSKLMKRFHQTEDLCCISCFWAQMLLAVNEAHKHGIMHLDLKPANFVLVDYKLKLIDFGIASLIPDDKTSVFKDSFGGTLNYMSPEAVCFVDNPAGARGCRISRKSDVWSLGCILYSWIYGSPPYYHVKNRNEKLMAIARLDDEVKFPEKVGVPVSLMNSLKACLQKDRNKRPTVEELLKVNIEMPLISLASLVETLHRLSNFELPRKATLQSGST